MTDRTRAEDVYDALRPGRELWRFGSQRVGWLRFSGVRFRIGRPGVSRQQSLLGQKRAERDPTHARGHVTEETSAIEQVAPQE